MSLGKNLKTARLKKGYSLQDLADRSGVSRAMLSKIEREEKNPTVNVACQIAEALDMTVSQLLGQVEKREVILLKEDQRQILRDEQTGFERRLLSPAFPSKGIEFILNIIPEGKSSGLFPAHKRGVKEYVYVEKGRLKITLNESQTYILNEGDSIYFEADAKHQFDNIGAGECRYYLVIDSNMRQLSDAENQKL